MKNRYWILRSVALIWLAVNGSAAIGVAEDTVTPTPPPAKTSPFPKSQTPNVEPPPIDSNTIDQLRIDQLYLVRSDTSFILTSSPPGIVKTQESGPVTISGVFFDGGADRELRSFTDKFVVIVEPIKGRTGLVELIYYPAGAKSEADLIRKLIHVGVGSVVNPELSNAAKKVRDALTGVKAKSDATALMVASEQIIENLSAFKDGADLLPKWGNVLAANGWVKGSRPEIATMIAAEIPPGEAKPFTDDDRKRLTALFQAIIDGCKAVLK